MEDIEDHLERDDMGAFHRRVEAALGCWNPATAHSFASNHRSKVPCPQIPPFLHSTSAICRSLFMSLCATTV